MIHRGIRLIWIAGVRTLSSIGMSANHIFEQVASSALEVVVFIVTVVDFSKAVHVHLPDEGYCLLRVKFVVRRLQVVGLEKFSV